MNVYPLIPAVVGLPCAPATVGCLHQQPQRGPLASCPMLPAVRSLSAGLPLLVKNSNNGWRTWETLSGTPTRAEIHHFAHLRVSSRFRWNRFCKNVPIANLPLQMPWIFAKRIRSVLSLPIYQNQVPRAILLQSAAKLRIQCRQSPAQVHTAL